MERALRRNQSKQFARCLPERFPRLCSGWFPIPMNDRVQEIIRARWQNGSELIFPSPKTGKQGTSIKSALKGACERAKISKLGTRVLRRTFGTMLEELNFSSTVQAKLLGHGDLRSLNRYGRGKKILREAVEALPKTNFS